MRELPTAKPLFYGAKNTIRNKPETFDTWPAPESVLQALYTFIAQGSELKPCQGISYSSCHLLEPGISMQHYPSCLIGITRYNHEREWEVNGYGGKSIIIKPPASNACLNYDSCNHLGSLVILFSYNLYFLLSCVWDLLVFADFHRSRILYYIFPIVSMGSKNILVSYLSS